MNLIIECLFIGLYTSLFSIISLLKININIILFIIGFLKHFLGYYIGIHNYYCNKYGKKIVINKNIIYDSIYEGIYFILVGKIIIVMLNINNTIIELFIIGFILHLISEYIGLHKYFYTNRCK